LEEAEYRSVVVKRALDLIRSDFEPQTWAAFTGVMVDGRSAKDVAAELGMTVNAVYLACHRVMTRLREEIDGLME
jgi:RNA polymerase sigma-70 factor (ECF subfamily)